MSFFNRSSRSSRRLRSPGPLAKLGVALEVLEDRRMLHTLTTGSGDGGLILTVDGYGSFGTAINFDEFSQTTYDPVGDIGPAETTFESGVAIRFGDSGERQFLTSGNILGSGGLDEVNVIGSLTSATATFEYNGLSFVVVQSVESMLNDDGDRTGSVLTQRYEITNVSSSALDFELLRYIDGDLLFDGSRFDGGGRIVAGGREILFETDAGGTGDTDTTFLGVDAIGGTIPSDARYEIDSYSELGERIIAGTSLDNMIAGDSDNDGFVDAGAEYDVTLGLRNQFNLTTGTSITYTTRTIFGSGRPGDVQPPLPVELDRVVVELGPSVTQLEGDSGITPFVFEIRRLEPIFTRILAAYSTFDLSASSPSDYQARSGVVTFMPFGPSTQFVTVNVVGDLNVEPSEAFAVVLTGVSVGLLSDRVAIGTIINDDPKFSISDASVFEGDDGTTDMVFAVTVSTDVVTPIAMTYSTIDGTATAGVDYEATAGTLTFTTATPRTQNVTVRVLGDLIVESNETFLVRLDALTGGRFTRNEAVGTILNDDVDLAVNDITVIEGDAGTKNAVFVVSAAGAVNRAVTVSYTTLDVTAMAASDYQPRAGTVTINPGASSTNITVPIIGDTRNEATETFNVLLTTAANARIDDSLGVATILDNDAVPFFYIGDVQLTTTAAGVFSAVFTVALDAASGRDVTVRFATADHTAFAGADYAGQNGMLTFTPGVTTRQVSIPVFTSGAPGPNKDFLVNLFSSTNALINDPQGVATIVYGQGPQAEYIADNGGLGFTKTGTWNNLVNTLAYQLDYDYAPAGNGSSTATWAFTGIPHTTYQVFVRWIPFVNRATNAPFTIFDGTTPLATVSVNQQQAPASDQSEGIAWRSLGSFSINSGALSVRLSNDANGLVVADAVRIVTGGIAPQVPEIDVSGFEHSIGTGDVTPTFEDATDFGAVASATGSAMRTFTIANHGNAPLHLMGSPAVTLSGPNAAEFSVVRQPASQVAPGGETSFDVVFKPTGTGARTATITIANDDASESSYQFVVRGTGNGSSFATMVIDDAIGSFTTNWTLSPDGEAYAGQLRTALSGAGEETARWDFVGLAPGAYDVYATWVPGADRATNAPFTVSNLVDNSYTRTINQQLDPGVYIDGEYWADLGTIDVTGGSLRVGLSNNANGVVAADAVLIVPTGFVPPPPPAPPVLPLAHNTVLPQDVNGDNHVSAHDALLVINRILEQTAEPSAAPLAAPLAATPSSTYFVDVNGDGRLSPHDVLMVINYLLSPHAVPAAAPLAATSDDDEPDATSAVDVAITLLSESEDEPLAAGLVTIEPTAAAASGSTAATSGPLMLAPEAVESLLAEDDESSEDELELTLDF